MTLTDTITLLVFFLLRPHFLQANSGEYLQTVMQELQHKSIQRSMLMNALRNHNPRHLNYPVYPVTSYRSPSISQRTDYITEVPEVRQRSDNAPSLDLTKGELAALYEAAVHKGFTVDLNAAHEGSLPVHAAVHEVVSHISDEEHKTPQGYYYYYYPLKSFMGDHGDHHDHHGHHNPEPAHEQHHEHEMSYGMPYSYPDHHQSVRYNHAHHHSHDHKHNVYIDMAKDKNKESNDKGIQPLFMAISGFIGMAVMFAATVLFMPKSRGHKSRGISDELASLTRLVTEAIEGQDCSERISCEVGQVLRNSRMDDKPLRIMEMLLPAQAGNYVKAVRLSSLKNKKCNFIPCRKRMNSL